jgi:hypothetical protein
MNVVRVHVTDCVRSRVIVKVRTRGKVVVLVANRTRVGLRLGCVGLKRLGFKVG